MRTGILGDIHGRWSIADRLYHTAMEGDIDLLIQVGDFGYWPKSSRKVWHREFEHPNWFIDGNHEDFHSLVDINEPNLGLDPYHSYPDWPRMMDQWVHKPRGHIERGILFIGGASSIDRQWRTPGLDWFPEENISHKQCVQIIDSIEAWGPENIHTVITHDCPSSFKMRKVLSGPENIDNNRRFLERVRKTVRPERWYFGHYHHKLEGEIEGTHWRCVGMVDHGDFVIVDLPDQ